MKPKFAGLYLQTRVSGGKVPQILASRNYQKVAFQLYLVHCYLETDGVEFDTYWQNGGYKKISDIIFAEWHIFIVSNL